jgi:hypothetical protein
VSLGEVQARIAQIEQQIASLSAGTAAPATRHDPTAFATALAQARPTATPGAGPVASAARVQFAHSLLHALGAPDTAENVRAITAWAAAEGTRAANNPLATTQRWPGATPFNAVGVESYATPDDGVAATAATLRNGRYDAILAALARGDSAIAVAQAVAASPWGTGDGVLRRLGAA